MKKLMAFGLAMMMCLLCASAFAEFIGEGAVVAPDSKELVVSLRENGTTGYVWTVAGLEGQATLALKDDQTVIPAESEGLTGAPSIRMWTFTLDQPGTVTLTFTYGRAWEEKGIDTRTLTVTLTADGALSYAMDGWNIAQ